MKKIVVFFLTAIFSLSLLPDGVDLVALQKKEKERRKKAAKSKYVLNNDTIVKYSLKKSKSYVKSDVPAGTEEKKNPKGKKKEEEKKGEEYWRGRLKALNDSIEQIRNRLMDTQSALNKASSDFLIASTPTLQQQLRDQVNNLQRQVAELEARLKQKQEARESFFTEARRAGALPGWLR